MGIFRLHVLGFICDDISVMEGLQTRGMAAISSSYVS